MATTTYSEKALAVGRHFSHAGQQAVPIEMNGKTEVCTSPGLLLKQCTGFAVVQSVSVLSNMTDGPGRKVEVGYYFHDHNHPVG